MSVMCGLARGHVQVSAQLISQSTEAHRSAC